jgi:hypothetical protein
MSAVKSTVVVTDDERTLESSYLHFKDDLTIQIHIEKIPPEPGQKLHLDIMFTAFKSNSLLFVVLHAIIFLTKKLISSVDMAHCQQDNGFRACQLLFQ